MKTTANRLLTCLGIHLLFLELLVSAAKKKPRDYSPAIYYGDSDVYIGNPFSITCIISISDPIDWLKDGESIKNHNLRHGKDVHAFFISEHPIEGESDKIEARLNVKHALQIHEGKYQCNPLHSSYHYLKVHKDNQLSNTSNNINNKFSGTGTGISTGPSIASGVGGTSIGDSGSDGGSSNAVETNLDTSSISSVYSYRPKKPLLSTSSEQPSAAVSVLSSSSTTTSLLSGGGFGSVSDVNLTRIGPGKMKTRLNYDSDIHHQQQQQRHQYTEQKQRHHGIISTGHSITSNTNTNQQQQQLPPFYYDQQQPELTTRNVMRNTGIGAAGGGNVHVIHHNKPPTGFFIDSTETDVTSIEDDDIVGGISLKPFITTSLPGGRKFHDDGHGVVDPLNLNRDINLYTKRPQQQQSTLSSSSLSPSSSYSSTATTKLLLPSPSSTATTATTGRKHHLDDLVSVTSSIIDINRMDSDVSQSNSGKETILVYNIYKNLTLNCDLPQIGDRKIIWEKNGTDINSIETLKGRHKIKENKFIIDKTNLDDAGSYSCSIKDSPTDRREFRAYAQIEVRVPSNLGVVEGETLKIPCTVIGTVPYITWEHENLTINSTRERYTLSENDSGIQNAILEISNVSLSDRGEYKCVGRNLEVESISKPAEDTSYIRVKGKLAALWPFLGICAEVFVLCAIILIYEKKRNKTDLDESDTDPNTEQRKTMNDNSSQMIIYMPSITPN